MAFFDLKQITLRDGAVLTLRSPVEDEAPQLLEYLDTLRRQTPYITFAPGDTLPTLEQERGFIRQHLDNPCAVLITAWADGQLVAMSGVAGGGTRQKLRHRVELGISALAAWCDRGLGTLLMREQIAWCEAQPELHVLRLGVYADNHRAIAVYRKVGFEVEGVRRWSVRFDDGRYGDEVMMSRWVGSHPPA